ncbi:MAG: 2Fe-2S iron-sulfur cluster-binding protein [Prochlorococcaceae cyanobacterium]
MPTIRFEQEGQQVGCIEGANLRKAALDAGINPYQGLNNLNNCGGLGQCGTCVMEVLEGMQNLSPRSDVEQVYLADRPANYRHLPTLGATAYPTRAVYPSVGRTNSG